MAFIAFAKEGDAVRCRELLRAIVVAKNAE
jgi:hypothetical protein